MDKMWLELVLGKATQLPVFLPKIQSLQLQKLNIFLQS